MSEIKRKTTLLSGREINEYVDTFRLPIQTHCPHKWAMIDLECGNMYVLNPNEDPANLESFKTHTAIPVEDLKEIKKLIKRKLKEEGHE